MIASRRQNRNNYEKYNLEAKVDQFIEVGRQFVGGVSGAKPGVGRNNNIRDISRRNVRNVTRWVSDRVDSIFDEEDQDDWDETRDVVIKDNLKSFSRDDDFSQFSNTEKKKPLTAISLREPNNRLKANNKQLPASKDTWPDNSDFQVNRWKRSSIKVDSNIPEINESNNMTTKIRNLPKSSRRRFER
tara:strand:- start:178 stop:738 length:561 start_codon:yes stop_codon:yes gene_type:complete